MEVGWCQALDPAWGREVVGWIDAGGELKASRQALLLTPPWMWLLSAKFSEMWQLRWEVLPDNSTGLCSLQDQTRAAVSDEGAPKSWAS